VIISLYQSRRIAFTTRSSARRSRPHRRRILKNAEQRAVIHNLSADHSENGRPGADSHDLWFGSDSTARLTLSWFAYFHAVPLVINLVAILVNSLLWAMATGVLPLVWLSLPVTNCRHRRRKKNIMINLAVVAIPVRQYARDRHDPVHPSVAHDYLTLLL
jgi:Flp pilus assembly protein TadB